MFRIFVTKCLKFLYDYYNICNVCIFSFSLDSLGEVRVAKLLNATAASLVTLVVFANNSFGLISTTTVAITIQNSAILGPTFYPPTYKTTVLEGTTIMNPTVIIVVSLFT